MADHNRNKPSQQALDEQRRSFVKSSVLLGAGAATAAALPGAAVAATEPAKAPESKQKGYQVTQHVIDYYKSAAN